MITNKIDTHDRLFIPSVLLNRSSVIIVLFVLHFHRGCVRCKTVISTPCTVYADINSDPVRRRSIDSYRVARACKLLRKIRKKRKKYSTKQIRNDFYRGRRYNNYDIIFTVGESNAKNRRWKIPFGIFSLNRIFFFRPCAAVFVVSVFYIIFINARAKITDDSG